jgi:hypothetical protein
MKWIKSTYMGPHEWVCYDDTSFRTWDFYATRINEFGYNKKRSFRGNPPKTYRYWDYNGYTYWIVGKILNRRKTP